MNRPFTSDRIDLGERSDIDAVGDLLPVAGLAIWWAVRRELRPVDILRQAIGARDGVTLYRWRARPAGDC